MKRFMRTILPDIEPLQQPLQLAALEAEHPGLTLGPGKPVPLQPLLPETKTVAVPVEDLDHIPAPVAEGKQIRRHSSQETMPVPWFSARIGDHFHHRRGNSIAWFLVLEKYLYFSLTVDDQF